MIIAGKHRALCIYLCVMMACMGVQAQSALLHHTGDKSVGSNDPLFAKDDVTTRLGPILYAETSYRLVQVPEAVYGLSKPLSSNRLEMYRSQLATKNGLPKRVSRSRLRLLDQWNEIGRKLIAIAEDLPEVDYDYMPTPDSRLFVEQLLHAAGSMYLFTDVAQRKQSRYKDDPKHNWLNTNGDVVAFVKQSVKEGSDLIKTKGETGLKESVMDGHSQLIPLEDLAYAVIEHSAEHYGQLVVYYEINDMVPPESRRK